MSGPITDPRHDPYAPPQADVQRAMVVAHAPGRVLAVVYAAAVAGNVVGRATAYLAPYPIARIASYATGVFGFATTVLALSWLYFAWKGIPPSHRGTLSPRRAALSMLIPIYNLYWAIAVNLALCDTLDGILERNGEERRAPRMLAKVAGIVWIGSYLLAGASTVAGEGKVLSMTMPIVTGGLWLAYMVRCDAVRDVVSRIGDDTAHLGPPALSRLQREKRGPVILAVVVWVFLALLAVACWQLLAPAERPARHGVAPRGT